MKHEVVFNLLRDNPPCSVTHIILGQPRPHVALRWRVSVRAHRSSSDHGWYVRCTGEYYCFRRMCAPLFLSHLGWLIQNVLVQSILSQIRSPSLRYSPPQLHAATRPRVPTPSGYHLLPLVPFLYIFYSRRPYLSNRYAICSRGQDAAARHCRSSGRDCAPAWFGGGRPRMDRTPAPNRDGTVCHHDALLPRIDTNRVNVRQLLELASSRVVCASSTGATTTHARHRRAMRTYKRHYRTE